MSFSWDTLLECSMTLTRLNGAKSLRDPLVSTLLGEWVASSPLARGRWAEATEIANRPLIRNKQIGALKQYAGWGVWGVGRIVGNGRGVCPRHPTTGLWLGV